MIIINLEQHYIEKILFDNRIYKCSGQEFEYFFIEVMRKKNENIIAVKAYGNSGDMKNDAFDPETGTYYQVFSPEDITRNNTISSAIKKLKNDFQGLYNHWHSICPIRTFYFVINDKYKGVPAPIEQEILNLRTQMKSENIEIYIFDSSKLQRIFFSLDSYSKTEIVGYISNVRFSLLEMNALQETIEFLINKEFPSDQNENLSVPDFENKIEFNHLSEIVRNKLIEGSYQEGLLQDYFDRHPSVKEELQRKFLFLYKKAKESIPDTVENYADRRFFDILSQACPKKTTAIQACAHVLMSYYFASCDIFEEP